MAKKKQFIPCSIKQFTEDVDIHAAARFAVSINPANRPCPGLLAKLGMVDNPLFISLITTKYFGPGGVHLTVGFLEPTTAALADKILSHMNAWGAYCNAKFTMVAGAASRAQVRISRGGGGYYSYLGVDVLHIPSTQQTMNLQGFSLNTPDSEYRRVIRHETGHTLGAPHEHMRAEIVNRLDPQKTIAYFAQNQGWSATEVQQQVLTPLSETSLLQLGTTPHAEEDSVMCYQLPGSITRDGRPIVGGVDITANDGLYLGRAYPLAVVPPPPPPPPPDGKTTITLEVIGKTAKVVSVV